MQWDGIRRDVAYTESGAYFVRNCRFYIEGEMQRRNGLSKLGANSGTDIVFYRHPLTGTFALYAGSGNVDAVAL